MGVRRRPHRDALAGARRGRGIPRRPPDRLENARRRRPRRSGARGAARPLSGPVPAHPLRRLVPRPHAAPGHRSRPAPPPGRHHPAARPAGRGRRPRRGRPARPGSAGDGRRRRGRDRRPRPVLPPVHPVRPGSDRDGRPQAPRERRPPVRADPHDQRHRRGRVPRRDRPRRAPRHPSDHPPIVRPIRAIPHRRCVLGRPRAVLSRIDRTARRSGGCPGGTMPASRSRPGAVPASGRRITGGRIRQPRRRGAPTEFARAVTTPSCSAA